MRLTVKKYAIYAEIQFELFKDDTSNENRKKLFRNMANLLSKELISNNLIRVTDPGSSFIKDCVEFRAYIMTGSPPVRLPEEKK